MDNELKRFHKYWTNAFTGKKGKFTKLKYKEILFSIWKHHNNWNDKTLGKLDGFQIKCQDRTMYRVIDIAKEAGLLIQVGNYSVNNFTRQFKKNDRLFDLVLKDDYNIWINKKRTKKVKVNDFVNDHLIEKLKNKNELTIPPSVKILNNIPKKKINNLCYDLEKLYLLCETMLPHYYNLLLKMNKAVVHDDFNFLSFIHFDNEGLPSGRPYSYFCSTLNPKKKHKFISPTDEYRNVFLDRVGLPKYHEVYDIKSEFPRVNYLFHTGEWKDDNFDFYAEIINRAGLSLINDVSMFTISRGETKFNNYNESMKQLFMRIYFGKGTDKQSYTGYVKEREKRFKKYEELFKSGDFTDDDLLEAMNKYNDVIDIFTWKKLCVATREVCGKPLGNLVMWFSFFIETEVKIELLKRGKKVYNVYDGFYYDKNIKVEIKKLLKEKALFVYDRYMKKIKL